MEPVTIEDLQDLKHALEDSFRLILMEERQRSLFYTASQFSHLTGMPYSTVVDKCKRGIIKAQQHRKGASWIIDGEELKRYQD